MGKCRSKKWGCLKPDARLFYGLESQARLSLSGRGSLRGDTKRETQGGVVMLSKRRFVSLLGCICIGWTASLGIESARAADHGDTPFLKEVGRHDVRIADLFAFLKETSPGKTTRLP